MSILACGLSKFSSAQEIAYSTADRATVRVIAVRGLEMVKESVNNTEIEVAVADGGFGTGVLVSEDGLIVTAHHVVENASHIVVSKLGESTPYIARVLATNPQRDAAILGIAGSHRDFLSIPKKAITLNARQTVFAIGYPLEITRTDPQSSRGIVSGVDPAGFLQLNMSINPGNSGGPVVDEQNRLVGIVVATRKNAEGIAYVVPPPVLRELAASIIPKRRLDAHKYANAKFESDQRLGQLVTAFAQQVHLLGGIWEGIERDHLASTRSLIERILGEHHDVPDVLAIVAGYFWNEALVLRARGDDEWQASRLRSATMCRRAQRIDGNLSKRSPFVVVAGGVDSSAPTPMPVANQLPKKVAGASLVAPQPSPAEEPRQAATVENRTDDPPARDGRSTELAGFRLEWTRDEVQAACVRAGYQLTTREHGLMPIASFMGPGSGGFATVMGPPDRQGHGATCKAVRP